MCLPDIEGAVRLTARLLRDAGFSFIPSYIIKSDDESELQSSER